jgi:50S ribosomal protein L16 3-hydroxylase
MDVNQVLPLLGGLTPAQFMRRYWQKKPLLVRQAVPGLQPLLSREALFALACQDDVESRLITHSAGGWKLKNGPFAVGSLPTARSKAWTLLVQGADLHDEDVHRLLAQFRFVPDARLDDLMISIAGAGGGVGPHFDSYDVFLLQASGTRRWQIGKQKDLTLQTCVPLKILQNFEAQEEYVLHAGDMLYLPPRYAHDGVAMTSRENGKNVDCMTYSIGFRAPARTELGAELLHRLAEFSEDAASDGGPEGERKPVVRAAVLYCDPGQDATTTPGRLPEALIDFAAAAVSQALKDPLAVACALGEYMTAVKPQVWFEEASTEWTSDGGTALLLDARSRMMYDANHIFINGESYLARGADARLMQRLADHRALYPHELSKASRGALDLLADWHSSGWLTAVDAANLQN